MATFFVCPINGALPADNGTDTTKANNVVNTESDAVQTASAVIGSTSATTLIVATGANFHVGDFIYIVGRNEWMQVTGISTNTLTVLRAQKGTVASGAIALNDPIITGMDINGNPPHCPICGAATQFVDTSVVTAKTGVAAGSQHPADVDAAYTVQADSPYAQWGATAYTLSGQRQAVQPHKFATVGGNVTRGTSTVTPETINSTVGP